LFGDIYAQVDVAGQSIVQAVRTVCIAHSCVHVMIMTIPHLIGDQYVLPDDDDDEKTTTVDRKIF